MVCKYCPCSKCQKYFFRKELKKRNKKYCPICNRIKDIYDFCLKYPNTDDLRRRHYCDVCSYKYNSRLYHKRIIKKECFDLIDKLINFN